MTNIKQDSVESVNRKICSCSTLLPKSYSIVAFYTVDTRLVFYVTWQNAYHEIWSIDDYF